VIAPADPYRSGALLPHGQAGRGRMPYVGSTDRDDQGYGSSRLDPPAPSAPDECALRTGSAPSTAGATRRCTAAGRGPSFAAGQGPGGRPRRNHQQAAERHQRDTAAARSVATIGCRATWATGDHRGAGPPRAPGARPVSSATSPSVEVAATRSLMRDAPVTDDNRDCPDRSSGARVGSTRFRCSLC